MITQFQYLKITRSENGIRTIYFDRAQKKNAIKKQTFYDIISALDEASRDDETKIVVFTGNLNQSIKHKLNTYPSLFKQQNTFLWKNTTPYVRNNALEDNF